MGTVTLRPGQRLGVFSLVMINVIAVNNLSSLSFSAKFGLDLFLIYALAALTFLLPLTLMCAELSATWPEQGGIYAWVKHAFGPRWGFFIVWLQWIYNIFWYPTILMFLASTLCAAWFPNQANNPHVLLPILWVLFLGATLANTFGMRLSNWISTLGSLLGTLLPMTCLIGLGAWAWFHPVMDVHAFSQHQPASAQFGFFMAMLFGMVGIEIAGAHARDVDRPRWTFPRAMLISFGVIAATQLLAATAIALLVPQQEINVVTGVIQAFSKVSQSPVWHRLVSTITALMIFGGLSGVSAWLLGPAKGVMQAAQDGYAPAWLGRTNRWGAPGNLLLLQTLLFLPLSAFFNLPDIQKAYALLTIVTTQFSLMVYVVLVAALWRLRQSRNTEGHYQLPGGRMGLITVSLAIVGNCLIGIIGGFWPVASLSPHSLGLLIALMMAVLACPWWLSSGNSS